MNELVIYPKRGRMIGFGILSLLFVILGIIFYNVGLIEDDLTLTVIGFLLVLIFGFCLFYYIKVLIKRKPALIISDEGISDYSSYLGPGLIRWDEIEGFEFVGFGSQQFLGIYTKDPELIINRASGLRRVINRMNKGLINTQVNIMVKNLDCSSEDLVETINSYFVNKENNEYV
ncbi:STM3941 family protein [Piscibacillus halophilus]|uniref:STM3941 family protein n=1 Tax=Piscibacillus halophilus TaxID=571933 RepID=UPI00240A71EC|nr:STM3941 family protein [Piscibacillus halophilus]